MSSHTVCLKTNFAVFFDILSFMLAYGISWHWEVRIANQITSPSSRDFRMQCLHFRHGDESQMLVAVENLLKLMNWRRSWFEQIKLYSLTNTYFSLCPKLDFKYLSLSLFKADNTLFSIWSEHIIWQFSSLADKEISTTLLGEVMKRPSPQTHSDVCVAPVETAVHAPIVLVVLVHKWKPILRTSYLQIGNNQMSRTSRNILTLLLVSPNTWMPKTAPCKTNASPEVQIFFVFYTNK